MRWLLHGTLDPAVSDALRKREDHVQSSDAMETDAADRHALLKEAHKKQLDVVTNDAELISTSLGQGVGFGRSIVYLQLEGGAVEQDDAIERLFARYKRLNPGQLYTVTASRVKVRQLPKT